MNQRYMHRDRKILNLSHKLHDCTLQIPGICTGYESNGCVPAHSNQQIHGRGSGLKSHDIFHAAACNACHYELDFGKKIPQDDKNYYWQRGFERTLLEYVKLGWLIVAK